jgi:site-specific recombinase XerD
MLPAARPSSDLEATRHAGEVGEVLSEALSLAEAYKATLVAQPQTQATYWRACRRFVEWLGPGASAQDLTADAVSRYHAFLVQSREPRRSDRTIKKDRAALNSFIRWCQDQELIDPRQAKLALSVKLPKGESDEDDDGPPKALSPRHVQRMLAAAKARVADDELKGRRDVAILVTLLDAGLRAEELAFLDRRDFLPARDGARKRSLNVRFGKGSRQRKVKLTARATRAIILWERARADAFGAPEGTAPLFITLGRRRRDGSYSRPGGRVRQWALNDLCKTLGAAAEIPEDLRHPHALRHTCATEMLRRNGVTLVEVQRHLGHADPKTTAIYTRTTDDRLEWVVDQLEKPLLTIDEDRDAA